MLGGAARHCRVDTDAALLRDLAAEIEWAKVSNVRPDDYPRLASESGRSIAGVDAATTARVMAAMIPGRSLAITVMIYSSTGESVSSISSFIVLKSLTGPKT